jgi:hypothetical protein
MKKDKSILVIICILISLANVVTSALNDNIPSLCGWAVAGFWQLVVYIIINKK